MSKGVAILSDKRVYFQGTCYRRDGNKFHKTSESRIVDVKDITGTGFVNHDPLWMKVIGICCLVYAMIIFLGNFDGHPDGFLILTMLSTLVVGIILLVIYGVKKLSLFEISFAGGNISFETEWLNQEEIQTFQRNIRLAKDAYEEQHERHIPQTALVAEPKPAPEISSGNVADELKKYKELSEQGIISAEEFEEIKGKLLHRL